MSVIAARSRLWIALHGLVATLPALGVAVHTADVPLYGAEVAPALPPLTLSAWKNETFQPGAQRWFESHVAFRGVMVRTDNTVQAALLGESKPGSNVILGSDQTLFVNDDLYFMSMRGRDLPVVAAKIDDWTTRLASVKRKLDARGKTLVVVIAPSKTSLYPEAAPRAWRRGDARSDEANHAALRATLERKGIPFGDAHTMFAGKTGADRQLVFPYTGRHWTTLGSCLVLREALREGPVTPSCAYTMAPADRRYSTDFDLYNLVNVWRVEEPAPLGPVLAEHGMPDAASSAHRPRTLFVGTSFMWMLIDVIRPFVDAPIAFYYNRTVYDVSEGHRVIEPVDASSPRWPSYALERDLYVIEILETYSHGEQIPEFIQTLDERLE